MSPFGRDTSMGRMKSYLSSELICHMKETSTEDQPPPSSPISAYLGGDDKLEHKV